ncbi:MAG: RNA pyrophosphohydrolase [Gammaproteobacteria bacterium]|nr:RNA pyrophosphohydrolase [Gammaproteobacteria bacterium]
MNVSRKSNSLIDENGYRLNVGIILCNQHHQLLWARRIGQEAWQFPQGGVRPRESAEQALFRELHEEVGLEPPQVEILGTTSDWLHYQLPERLIRYSSKPLCIGQKQRWFLLRLLGSDHDIRLDRAEKPEFDHWKWVDYWQPLSEVVDFKRDVYQRALAELEPLLRQPRAS